MRLLRPGQILMASSSRASPPERRSFTQAKCVLWAQPWEQPADSPDRCRPAARSADSPTR